MKHLLVVYHSKTGHTKSLVDAVCRGIEQANTQLSSEAEEPALTLRCLQAQKASFEDLLWADGLVLATPENFGYMSGAMKDFFDRTYYEVGEQFAPLPYLLIVGAGNDGSGAVRAIERIAKGYPLIAVAPALISALKAEEIPVNNPTPEKTILDKCEELGATLAAGVDLGMY